MKPVFTGLSPNAENDDAVLALRLLFSPSLWRKGSAREILERTVGEFFEGRSVFAFESGRTSLMMILRALELSEGDEVLTQAYTCVAVPNAIRWAGATPNYVDCDSETRTMDTADLEKKITPRSRAIILQHTFGNPGNLSALIAIAKKHNLFVIEDCAHTIGGSYDGRTLGLWGDAAILSFGRDKAISSVFGGVCIVNDDTVATRIKNFQQAAPMPSATWVLQQLLHPLICWLTVATFTWGIGKLVLFVAKKIGLLSLAVLPCERAGERPKFVGKQMSNALALLALHQWSKLKRLNEHRRSIAVRYAKALGLSTNTEIQWVPLRYVINVENPDLLMRFARSRGIFLGDWYRQPIAPDHVSYSSVGYNVGSCPNAERASETSLNLPLDIHISPAAADRIIACVQEYDARKKS